MSVCLSVTHSYSVWTPWTVIHILNFFHRRAATPFSFSVSNGMAIMRQGSPQWGVESWNARESPKTMIFDQFLANRKPHTKLSDGTSLNDFEWPGFKVTILFSVKWLKNATRYSYIYTMADKQKVLHVPSNSAIFNYLEWPRPPVSRSRHSVTRNILVTVRDSDIVSMEY